MVLKRRLPSTLKPENKEGSNPSTQTPEMKAPPPMPEHRQPASKPSVATNPFEAQQQMHERKAPALPETPKPEVSAPAQQAEAPKTEAPKKKMPDFSAQADPFSAPIAPESKTEAVSSVVPKAEPVQFDDPFAAPMTDTNSALDAWAEEPSAKSAKPTVEMPIAKPATAASMPEPAPTLVVDDTKAKLEESVDKPKVEPKSQAQTTEIKTVGLGVVAVGLVAFIGYTLFFGKKEDTAEVVSRWTGALEEVSEELPEQTELVEATGKAEAIVQPEAVVVIPGENLAEKQEPSQESFPSEEEVFEEESVNNTAFSTTRMDKEKPVEKAQDSDVVVEFVDVSEEDVDAPIVADDAQQMPEDIGVIAKMQNAIVKAREERDGVAPVSTEKEVSAQPASEVRGTADELSKQLEAELAEYRKILMGANEAGDIIAPEQFFGTAESELVDNPLSGETAAPLPAPSREQATLSQSEAGARYGSNPYNLPVVPEPGQGTQTVRTLSDFDAAVFDAPTTKVRMPKHVRPSLRGTAFPPVLLLSIIQGRGVVAESNRKQGVLMIGETIDGWELVAVHREYAEFKRGERTHVLTLK